jgi:glutaredoxin
MKPAVLLLALLVAAAAPRAQYCPMITTPDLTPRIDSVMRAYRPTCCDGAALGACLKKEPRCSLAPRLANFACFLTVLGRDYQTIVTDLGKRETFMNGARLALDADTTLLAPAGAATAPVRVVVYVNASCPLCKRVSVPLYESVSAGPLAGKARLYLVPFSAQVGNNAYVAAQRMGLFWKFYHATAEVRERLDEEVLVRAAEWLGVPAAKFRMALADKTIEKALQKNYEKAKTLGVSSTPTIFINGRKYESHKDHEWIVDAIEHEYEKWK